MNLQTIVHVYSFHYTPDRFGVVIDDWDSQLNEFRLAFKDNNPLDSIIYNAEITIIFNNNEIHDIEEAQRWYDFNHLYKMFIRSKHENDDCRFAVVVTSIVVYPESTHYCFKSVDVNSRISNFSIRVNKDKPVNLKIGDELIVEFEKFAKKV